MADIRLMFVDGKQVAAAGGWTGPAINLCSMPPGVDPAEFETSFNTVDRSACLVYGDVVVAPI